MLMKLAILTLALVPVLFASPEPCIVQPLQNYIDDADGCTIGDKVFDDFFYSSTVVSGAGTAPAATNVTVNPLDVDPLQPAIFFQSTWLSSPNSLVDLSLIFQVSQKDNLELMSGATLIIGGLSGAVLGGAEDFCLGDSWIPGGCAGGTQVLGQLPVPPLGGAVSYSWADDYGLQSTVGVLKDFSISTGPDGPGEISIVVQSFSQVPEPSTYAMLGMGLVAFALLRRRRTR